MATIYWRGSAAYLNWSEGGRQRRKSLGVVTAHEADVQRKAKELELATGRRIFIASARFDDHLERYLTWHRAQYPSSHFRVRQIAEQCFGDFQGLALSQITARDVERWKASRMMRVGRNRHFEEAVVSSETAAKELRTLKAILNKAVEWKEIEHSPAKDVKAPKNLRSQPIHWYSKDQLIRLYKGRHGSVWRLMANTGLRRAEAQQLRIRDVNLKDGYLNVCSSEGARTKSGRWRQVPLSDNAHIAVRRLIRSHGKTKYLLPRMTGPSLSRAFLKHVKRKGLDGSLHSLRHSYGAHLVMAGVPLRTVQILMGHASFTTTERYAHLGKDHLRDQARLVNL